MGIAKNLYRSILRILPDRPALYVIYFRGYRKILNLNHPKYLGEKIQWLKLYGHLDELGDFVDKHKVREFVTRTAGEKYLNQLYGVYDRPEDINYDKLPKQFVLKCTNGSGAVLICKDKEQFNKEKAAKIMNKWLKDDFHRMKKESQYKYVKKRIIAEGYLEDESGALRDYKFYCYDGEPLYYSIFTDRYTDETVDTYDMTGKKLDVINGGVKNSPYVLPQDEYFPEMINLVKILAKPFQFVRVDLYKVNDRILFGELTFTDGAGAEPFTPLSFDLEIAKRIKLGKVLQKDKL